MFGIDDVAIGGIASVAGGIAQAAFSARQAAIQRDFQERMAGSQIQRRVQDAEAAGINPIFAVSGGAGAAAPIGASASAPSLDPMVGVASAASAYRTYQEGRKAKVEADTLESVQKGAPAAVSNFLGGGFSNPFSSSARQVERDYGDMERFFVGSPNFVPYGGRSSDRPKAPASAVEASRGAGIDVVPGGAFVGNRPAMGGQLGRLRSKALQKFVGE